MATYQTQGIILKKTDQGEADQLFSIYTLEKGKVLALGRGTKKISSKLNCHLQSFAILQLLIASGKNYDHLAGVVIAKNFTEVKNDLKKIVLASFGLELVEKLTKVDQPDPNIFNLLVKYFEAINNHQFSDPEWQVASHGFAVKFLSLLGLAPKAEVVTNINKLNTFLKNHLDSELQTDKFLAKISHTT